MRTDATESITADERKEAERGRLLTEVANAVVRIHKRFYGRGPTKARAHLSQDLLTVLLDGGYTRGEQTLNARGYVNEVVQARLAMRRAVEEEFRAAIESLVKRRVRSFMSANDPSTDLQAEIFVLHPRGRADDGAQPDESR